MKQWKKLSSEHILKSPWLGVRKDAYGAPDGTVVDDFYVVERPDFAVVVPLTAEQEFVVVEQYRHGAEATILNFPMGFIEKGEDPVRAAERELREETRCAGGLFVPIGSFLVASALMKTRAHVFLARGVSLPAGESETSNAGEIDGMHMLSKKEIEDRIATGALDDLASVAAYLLVKGLIA